MRIKFPNLLLIFFLSASVLFAGKKETHRGTIILKEKSDAPISYTETHKFIAQKENSLAKTQDGGIIFWEDFEPGGDSYDWTAVDSTLPLPEHGPAKWVTDTFYPLDGPNWRCANLSYGNNGGYGNHWYQVLDTPPMRDSQTDVIFSFYHRYSIEDPSGAEDPWDGWDGCNVRISTDNGETWQVLSNGSYNVSNSWAFGNSTQGQNEGTGIPSWAGTQNSWTKESFDLSGYITAEQPFILRFAFASDRAFSTAFDSEGNYDPDLFGWQIDSILVSRGENILFSNNGEDTDLQGKDIEYFLPAGGNLWHTAEITVDLDAFEGHQAPEGSYSASCQNGNGYTLDSTYNRFMDNLYMTGPITLPETEPIYLDFKHVPYFIDFDEFPDVEFFRPEILPADSTNWEWIEDEPYVYNESSEVWLEFGKAYGFPINQTMFDLSKYAGQDVYLNFRFWSDDDAPIGPGLLIDDVVIYSPTNVYNAPVNVSAEPVSSDTSIIVTWDYEPGMYYSIWRAESGSQDFFYRGQVKDSSKFIDTGSDVRPLTEYAYAVSADVKYEGGSQLSMPDTVLILPETVVLLGYSDGQANGYIESQTGDNVAVKITPPAYPSYLTHIKIHVNPAQMSGTSARLNIFTANESGQPGEEQSYQLFTGLRSGWNIISLKNPVKIESGSIFAGYERFQTSPYLSKDTDTMLEGITFEESAGGWNEVTDYTAMIETYIDTSGNPPVGISDRSIEIAKQFDLGNNYPNPFNPETTIPLVVPADAAGEQIRLEIFNVLGQKINTLINGPMKAGKYTIIWNGLDKAGNAVSSGIYIYRLTGKDIQLSRRMLLIK
ncbi:MAG: FlgD immunoglobulin-like domain containing protein [Calditrichaceae bacterium]